MQKLFYRWSLIAVPLLLILLFVSGPGAEAGRIYRQLWESGHFALFAGLFFIVASNKFFQKINPLFQAATVIALSALIGLATEYMQLLVDRNFELKDVLNDVLGGTAGLLFGWTFNSKSWQRTLYWLLLITVSMVGIRSFLFALADEYRLRRDFPEIANFEHFAELYRWDMRSAYLRLSDKNVTDGDYSLKVQFYPAQYPDITLLDFGRDWRFYNNLELDIFNPQSFPLKIELKIYDEAHRQNNYRYSDRYNHVLTLNPGKNQIKIPLSEIENAPADRKIELSNMQVISLFFEDLDKTVTLYFDYFRLTQN